MAPIPHLYWIDLAVFHNQCFHELTSPYYLPRSVHVVYWRLCHSIYYRLGLCIARL